MIWVIVACGFGVGEMLTTGFFLAPFAIGAALAAAADAAVGETAAWVVFFAVALLTLSSCGRSSART